MDEAPKHRPSCLRDYLPFWVLFSAAMGSGIANHLSPTAEWTAKSQGPLWGAAAAVIITLVAGTISYPAARRFQTPHSVLLAAPAIPAFQADLRIHSLAEAIGMGVLGGGVIAATAWILNRLTSRKASHSNEAAT